MQKRNRLIVAIAGGALALTGGGAGTAFAMSNEVTIDVYGDQTTVRTFDKNVDDILEKQNIQITKIDKVTPSLNDTISHGETIIVEKLNVVELKINELPAKNFNTEVGTVGEIVKGAGYNLDEVRFSPAADTVLEPGVKMTITVETPKTVTFTGKNGKLVADDVFLDTVGEAAEKYLGDYKPETDKLEPAADTEITHGMTIDITRIRTAERTEKEAIDFKKVEKDDDSMYEGEEKITTKGVKGEKTITLKDKLVDGKVSETEKVKEEITKKPVNEVLSKGTKKKPEPVVEEPVEVPSGNSTSSNGEKSSSQSSNNVRENSSKSSRSSQRTTSQKATGSSTQSSGNGSGLLSGIPQWKIDRFDQLAQCESGGNWSINTHNGYFGGIQFDRQTWLGYGGGKFAPTADKATREQQIYVGNTLQNARGSWGSWPACSAKFGW